LLSSALIHGVELYKRTQANTGTRPKEAHARKLTKAGRCDKRQAWTAEDATFI